MVGRSSAGCRTVRPRSPTPSSASTTCLPRPCPHTDSGWRSSSTCPALQAHSTLRYADWRAVIARFVARRLGQPVDAFGPQLVGHVALAAAVAAYEQWLADETSDLSGMLRGAFSALEVRGTPLT